MTLEQARNYSRDMENYGDIRSLDYLNLQRALQILTESQDREHYKKIVDSFVKLAGKMEKKNTVDQIISENPLRYLEYMIMGMDYKLPPFWFDRDGNRLPAGKRSSPPEKHQSYFNKLYGEHFY